MKNKLIIYLPFLAFISFTAFIYDSVEPHKGQKLYSWVDKLLVREKPDLSAKPITFLKTGEEIIFLGIKSKKETQARLRGIYFKTPFYKIKKKNGTTGWVFGAGIQVEKPLSDDKKKCLVKQFKKVITIVNKMRNEINIKNIDNESKTFEQNGFYLNGQKGEIIFSQDLGFTPVGNSCYERYFKNGIIKTSKDDRYSEYRINNFPISANGIRPGISIEVTKRILGKPLRESANVLYYFKSGDMSVGMYNEYMLYFKNKRLFSISINCILGD